MIPTSKQKRALEYLTDRCTEFVGYGGSAGGGKSYLGCFYLMQLGYYAPGTKYFIGRDSLKDTRGSVLKTWAKLSKQIGFTEWKYSDNVIKFNNGSEIEFLDLSFYPQKDPLFERFGSKEYTSGWIEEAGQVHYMAFEVLKTRVGRWMNDEFNIKKKILCTFNPKKNWVDKTFYRPFAKGEEEKDTKFVYALPADNPHLPADYIETLRNLKDEATKQRLLYGNFDYDDDPATLITHDAIQNYWNGRHVEQGRERYLTIDVARKGKDSTVFRVWYGYVCVERVAMSKSLVTEVVQMAKLLQQKHKIQNTKTIADEDGVGGGVVDFLNCKGFVNNSSPIGKENYDNLKSQCSIRMADKIQRGEVSEYCRDQEVIELTSQEMEQVKLKNMDKDGKMAIIPKDEVKSNIGRSPDDWDSIMMREYFGIKKEIGNFMQY